MIPHRPTKVGHVVYRTRRFEAMLAWYQTVFGAKVQYQNPALAFLTFDGEHHRFAIANLSVLAPGSSEADRQDAIGVDHVGYTYDSLHAMFDNYEWLKAKGITPYWTVHHGITVAMYYADPDGNQMEFQVDCLDASQDPGEFMATTFVENPVGVEFNPDEWLSKIRTGASEAELLANATQGPVSPIRGALNAIMARQ